MWRMLRVVARVVGDLVVVDVVAVVVIVVVVAVIVVDDASSLPLSRFPLQDRLFSIR